MPLRRRLVVLLWLSPAHVALTLRVGWGGGGRGPWRRWEGRRVEALQEGRDRSFSQVS